jgi:DhnA family fructose-bisphosphate aldolase class Ia
LFQHGLCNGIALNIGLAEKFYWDFAGEIPLILKLNGKTLFAWAYPRGSAFGTSGGGADSFYAVDYAVRVASELGTDMVKVKFPHPEKRAAVPAGYDDDFSPRHAMEAVVRSASSSASCRRSWSSTPATASRSGRDGTVRSGKT